MFVTTIDPRALMALAASFRFRQRECVAAAEEMRLSLRPWAMNALMEQAERWDAKAQSCEAFVRATATPVPLPRPEPDAEPQRLALGRASW